MISPTFRASNTRCLIIIVKIVLLTMKNSKKKHIQWCAATFHDLVPIRTTAVDKYLPENHIGS